MIPRSPYKASSEAIAFCGKEAQQISMEYGMLT